MTRSIEKMLECARNAVANFAFHWRTECHARQVKFAAIVMFKHTCDQKGHWMGPEVRRNIGNADARIRFTSPTLGRWQGCGLVLQVNSRAAQLLFRIGTDCEVSLGVDRSPVIADRG